jgi:hypothetical protein
VKDIPYGEAIFNPKVVTPSFIIPKPALTHPTRQWMATKHEGSVLYRKEWNFFVRSGVAADAPADYFFNSFESTSPQVMALLHDAGLTGSTVAVSEEEVWSRIGKVWDWMKNRVSVDNAAYASIHPATDRWPSIVECANYYATHGNLVWAACFSKALLFATVLGRVIDARYRFGIATTHHTENGAPATASHVYVAAYVADRWFYLDPTNSPYVDFPLFANRQSIGVASFTTVDYPHPFSLIPLPGSDFALVPYLPA